MAGDCSLSVYNDGKDGVSDDRIDTDFHSLAPNPVVGSVAAYVVDVVACCDVCKANANSNAKGH